MHEPNRHLHANSGQPPASPPSSFPAAAPSEQHWMFQSRRAADAPGLRAALAAAARNRCSAARDGCEDPERWDGMS